MKGSAKYIILLFMVFFWSCIDFDRIIEYRETLYGGCCEYGKEVELRRAEKHGFGNTEFEKNSLFVSSDNDFFFYQNPKSFWDHSFTFSDEGIAGNIEISKGGEIFAVASQGSDSVVTNVEFYTISGGIPLQLERELQILKASENEYLQEYKLLFGDDYISMLFRDDSLRTNRVKFLRFNADSSKWVGVNYRNEEIHDLILDDAETIIKFQPVYSFDNDEIYVLTTDTDKNFKFYRQNSTEWYEPGLRSHGGEQTLPDSLKAHSFTYSNSMLLLSTVGQDTTILEQYFFDEFESRFIKRNGDLVGESAFLEKSTKLEYLRYQYSSENRYFLIIGNTEDTSKEIEAAVRLYELVDRLETGARWELRQMLRGSDAFATDFDVNLDASTLAIGEPSNGYLSQNAGAVQIYDISLNEVFIDLNQKLNIYTDASIDAGVQLSWNHIGLNLTSGDSLIYNVYRKIWESGQVFELIGTSPFAGRGNIEYYDFTANLDTNYQYVVVPFNKAISENGDWEYHESDNSIVTRPVNPDLLPKFYEGESVRMDFEVRILSGELQRKAYLGEFNFTKPTEKDNFTGSIFVDTLLFIYQDSVLTNQNMDYRPYVKYEAGEFTDLYLVGGASSKRFGINDGFSSFPEEQPFGYLNSRNFVEGFGIIYYLDTPQVNVDEERTEPESIELSQNYPNPFNPSTNISFTLPEVSEVQLKVFNLMGQEVATLVDRRMIAGNHTVNFDASQLSSGVYIYRLNTGSQSITKKMMLIK